MNNFDNLTDMADAQCLRETRDKNAATFIQASAEVLDRPELNDAEIQAIFRQWMYGEKVTANSFARAILKAQKEKQ
jgi:hypothetical protein